MKASNMLDSQRRVSSRNPGVLRIGQPNSIAQTSEKTSYETHRNNYRKPSVKNVLVRIATVIFSIIGTLLIISYFQNTFVFKLSDNEDNRYYNRAIPNETSNQEILRGISENGVPQSSPKTNYSLIRQKQDAMYDCALDSEPDWEDCVLTDYITIEHLIKKMPAEARRKQQIAPVLSYYKLKTLEDNEIQGYGGYVLVKTMDFKNADKIKKYTKRLHEDTFIPPFLGVDAEGGTVKRFDWHEFIQLRDLTQVSESKFCDAIAEDIDFFNETGLNWSVAPVVDYPYSEDDWIYDRTISEDKDEIIATAKSYIRCMSQAGIFTTIKHFPGHGDTTIDSHFDIPEINHSRDEWSENEGLVFYKLMRGKEDQKSNSGLRGILTTKKLLDQGRLGLDSDGHPSGIAPSVMVGHLVYPEIYDETATFSNGWLDDVVRADLHFDGLVVSDDLMMLDPDGVDERNSVINDAFSAGVDLVLIGF